MHALHSKNLCQNKKLWLIFVGLIVCIISLLIFVNASFADSDTGSDSDSNYSSEVSDDSNDGSYLTIHPTGTGYWRLELKSHGNPDNLQLQWCDTETKFELEWHDFSEEWCPSSTGNDIYIRGINNSSLSKSPEDYWYLSIPGPYERPSVNVSGNIMSLLDCYNPPNEINSDYCFCKFFNNMDCLQSCENLSLPNNVRPHCYESMFEGCKDLQILPSLPATSLKYMDGFIEKDAVACYAYMFKNCTSLIYGSDLSLRVDNLVDYCYQGMFEGCEQLINTPHFYEPSSIGKYSCANMFNKCSALNDFTSLQFFSNTNLAEGCYMRMLSGTAFNQPISFYDVSTFPMYCCKSMLEDCKNLTVDPGFSINSNLGPYCFENMLKGCSKFNGLTWLRDVFETDKLAEGCYSGMLSGTSVTEVITRYLPATQLPSRCYQSLFEDCKNLVSVEIFKVDEAGSYCCANMFSGCSSLENCDAELVDNNLSEGCYSNMFKGCVSLKNPPGLPATSLAEGCYEGMFQGSGLASAPDLPATTLVPNCYKEMFEGCVNLTHIKVSFTQWPQDDTSFSNWMAGVSPTGFFECSDELDTSIRDASHIPAGWVLANQELLSFSTTDESATISYNFEKSTAGKSINIYYSKNCVDWTKLTVADATSDPVAIAEIGKNEKLFVYGDNLSGFNDAKSCLSFVSEQNIKVHGKSSALVSLDSSETIPNPYCFKGLFKGCSGLSNMLELPYTQLTEGCYQSMYEGCANLESLCELPARELQKNCYAYMFKDCTSVTKAPELSATELKDGCYMGMFEGCNALTRLKVGFESWFDDGQHYSFDHVPTDGWLKDTQNMFLNGQQFYCPPDLDTDRIQDDSHVPDYWLAQKDAKISATISGYKAQYDGRKHKITVTLTSPIDAKVEYKGPEDDDFKESNPEFKDAGTYTVEVKISKASYVTLETSADVVIQKSTSGIMSIGDYEKLYSGAEPDYTATFKGLDITPEKGKDYVTYRDAGEDVLENNGTYTVHAVWINENSNFDVAEATGSLKIDKASAKLVADKNSMSEGEAMPTLTAHLEGARFGVDDLASDDYFVEPVNNGNGTYTLNPNLTEKGQRFLSNFNVEMVPSVMRVYSAGGSGGGSTPGGSGGVATQVIDNGAGDTSASETAITSTHHKQNSSNDEGTQNPFNPLTVASIVANAALLGGLIFLILKLKKVF